MSKICVVSIYVSDMELAKKFYCETLKFEISQEYDEDTVSLKHESIAVVLCKTDQPTQVQYPQQAQVVIGLEVDHLASAVEELKSHGVEMIYGESKPLPGGHFNALRDPFGNVIELLEFHA